MTFHAGVRLGHYRIISLLGRGGMADVYRAEDERLGREVALKAVPPEFARDPERVERFEREVRAAARLTHPNIVTVYEFGQRAGQHFYTMALMPGGDLKARIRAHPDGMPPEEARAVAAAMARALDYAHRQGFVHRDVKPENILFAEDGVAQLTDFGIARAMSSGTRMTATGMSIGSPHYMSPEQARGKEVDGRSDLYSLGVVLYEMLTGRVPFDAADTLAVAYAHVNDPVPELPPAQQEWQPVVDRLLAKSPDDRFGSAGELAEGLASDGVPRAPATRVMPTGRDLSSPARPQEPATRLADAPNPQRKTLVAVAGGALLALAVVGIGYVALRDGAREDSRTSNGGGGNAVMQTALAPETVLGGGALLVVETTPPGAEVLVDGVLVGETLLERFDIRAGVREVTLRHPYYETESVAGRNFEDGVVLRVERVLTRGTGRLTVTATPSDAWIELDGQRVTERTPVTLDDVPAGMVRLRVGAPKHQVLELEVEVPKDGLARLERRLSPIPHGSLTLDLEPSDATVTLPDTEFQYEPGLSLPEGVHRVIVRRDGYRDGERTVEIEGETWVRIALETTKVPGDVFRDDLATGGEGPDMVVIPRGRFRMGCLNGRCDSDEVPVRDVRIGYSFAMSKYEVTFAHWEACVADGGCEDYRPDDRGWGRGNHPVINVSWNDAQSYAAWLSRETEETYRLPSEAEWEYAARAGTVTVYYFGNNTSDLCQWGNGADLTAEEPGSGVFNCRDGHVYTAPVGSFGTNGFGLHDMHGNVEEWVEDCGNTSYEEAPSAGDAWLLGNCEERVRRGGSWWGLGRNLRASSRVRDYAESRNQYTGFRVVRTLAP